MTKEDFFKSVPFYLPKGHVLFVYCSDNNSISYARGIHKGQWFSSVLDFDHNCIVVKVLGDTARSIQSWKWSELTPLENYVITKTDGE